MAKHYERQSLECFILKALQSLVGCASRNAIKEEIFEDDSNNISYDIVMNQECPKKELCTAHFQQTLVFAYSIFVHADMLRTMITFFRMIDGSTHKE